MPKIRTLNELKRSSKNINGKWALDNRHRLTYTSQDSEEQIELEASLVAAEADALVVSVTQKQDKGKTVTSLAKINGMWRANEKNQLEFTVEAKASTSTVLTFTGSWTVNGNNEIIYSYRTRSRNSKTSKVQTLTFKGYWDLTENARLTYLIEGDTESSFRFRGTFQSPSILAKKGEIRYQLGVSGEGSRQKLKTITLFGRWRIGRELQVPAKAVLMQRALGKIANGLELNFEIEYADGDKRELRFGAEYNFTDDFSVSAQLIQKSGKPLGVEVILTKDFLKTNAKAFVRLRKSLQESAVETGISIPW